jgi:hypothetical protein
MFSVGGKSETLDPLAFRRGEGDGSQPPPNEAMGLQLSSSGEHIVRGGKHDCFVANAECARARIPDAPLSQLCGGPAYELAG